VGEDHLEDVFAAFSKSGIHVRMMQNSAVQFYLVYDTDARKQSKLIQELGKDFHIESTDQLELLTIRHGDGELIEKLTAGRKVLMEQVNPPTVRRLLEVR